jgi:hypothetical protein
MLLFFVDLYKVMRSEVKCREVKNIISLGVCGYFISCVLTILLRVL